MPAKASQLTSKENIMTPYFKLFLIIVLSLIIAHSSLADDGTYLLLGGWSKHASGVGYSNQTHNIVGVEHNDWVGFIFVNSLNDRSYFFGKSTEDIKFGDFALGTSF